MFPEETAAAPVPQEFEEIIPPPFPPIAKRVVLF